MVRGLNAVSPSHFLCIVTSLLLVSTAGAETRTVDRIAVRFWASETGGAERPQFITERLLAFEGRLEAMVEGAGPTAPLQERLLRAAMERHIAEEMLSSLRGEDPRGMAPTWRLYATLGRALLERAGGEAAVMVAAALEGIGRVEVDSVLRRQVQAAVYLDRTGTPLLEPTDEQLREYYRTAPHPYRNISFDRAKGPLGGWFSVERLRAAEGMYFQGARARIKVIRVVP